MSVTKAGNAGTVNEATRPSVWAPLLNRLVGLRRTYVVNWHYQFRVSLLTMGLVLVLLLLLNLSVYFMTRTGTEALLAVQPELQAALRSADIVQVVLTAVASLLFALGIFGLSILQTHKTAGAALNLCRCLRRIGEGRYETVARLRRNDNLHEMAEAINDMTGKLRDRATSDLETLQALAATAEQFDAHAAVRELRVGLRELIKENRRYL